MTTAGSAAGPDLWALLGAWSLPEGAVPIGVAVIALLLIASGARGSESFLFRGSSRTFVVVCGFVAAFASLGYVAYYLRGGPRIIDATSYFLQARALANGYIGFPVPEPSASFRGRFLLYDPSGTLTGIFPPGYPAILALGFVLGAPLVIGPLLAFALVAATHALGAELAKSAGLDRRTVRIVARCAALASVFCATLRYHTADTMAHGASALFVTLALLFALSASRCARTHPAHAGAPPAEAAATRDALLRFALSGLALGLLACTRPVSAVAPSLGVAWLIARSAAPAPHKVRAAGAAFACTLPPLLLFALYQRHATGSFFGSPQLLYYATSDGPPGCFRYGLGPDVGCLLEHGDFVRARLPNGHDVFAAAATTLRRLHLHVRDVANLELLVGFVLVALVRVRSAAVAACAVVLVAQFVAYAPFYFDGNYPGGGARFFADVLPIEHALLALGVARVVAAFTPHLRVHAARAALFTLAAMALGFAVHSAHDHAALRDREEGRPFFEPDVLTRANATSGILFVDTDHAMNLAHDPGQTSSHGVLVARFRDDDHDRVLFESMGRPPTRRYRIEAGEPKLEDWSPSDTVAAWGTYRFEAESEWPPIAQRDGWVEPIWASDTCASNGRALELVPAGTPTRRASALLELPAPREGAYAMTPHVITFSRARHNAAGGRLRVYAEEPEDRRRSAQTLALSLTDRTPLADWTWANAGDDRVADGEASCLPLEAKALRVSGERFWLLLDEEPLAGGDDAPDDAPGTAPDDAANMRAERLRAASHRTFGPILDRVDLRRTN